MSSYTYFVSYQNKDTGDLTNVEIDRDEPFKDIADIRELEAEIADSIEADSAESVVVLFWQTFGQQDEF